MTINPRTEQLLRLAARPCTIEDAMAVTGMSRSGLNSFARRHGARWERQHDKVHAVIAALSVQGLGATAIGREVGRDRCHVSRILKKLRADPEHIARREAQRLAALAAEVERRAAEESARKAQAERDEALRMARWRAAWAAKKAERLAARMAVSAPRLTAADLAFREALRREAEGHRRRA